MAPAAAHGPSRARALPALAPAAARSAPIGRRRAGGRGRARRPGRDWPRGRGPRSGSVRAPTPFSAGSAETGAALSLRHSPERGTDRARPGPTARRTQVSAGPRPAAGWAPLRCLLPPRPPFCDRGVESSAATGSGRCSQRRHFAPAAASSSRPVATGTPPAAPAPPAVPGDAAAEPETAPAGAHGETPRSPPASRGPRRAEGRGRIRIRIGGRWGRRLARVRRASGRGSAQGPPPRSRLAQGRRVLQGFNPCRVLRGRARLVAFIMYFFPPVPAFIPACLRRSPAELVAHGGRDLGEGPRLGGNQESFHELEGMLICPRRARRKSVVMSFFLMEKEVFPLLGRQAAVPWIAPTECDFSGWVSRSWFPEGWTLGTSPRSLAWKGRMLQSVSPGEAPGGGEGKTRLAVILVFCWVAVGAGGSCSVVFILASRLLSFFLSGFEAHSRVDSVTSPAFSASATPLLLSHCQPPWIRPS